MLGINHLLKTVIGVAVVNAALFGARVVPVGIATGVAVVGMVAGEFVIPDLVKE